MTLLFSGNFSANNLSSFIINPVSHRIQPVNGLIFDCDCLQEKAGIQLRNSRLSNQLQRLSNRFVITDNNIIDLNLTESPIFYLRNPLCRHISLVQRFRGILYDFSYLFLLIQNTSQIGRRNPYQAFSCKAVLDQKRLQTVSNRHLFDFIVSTFKG